MTTVGQLDFAQALVTPGLAVPAGLVSPRGTTDNKRFSVYRNNVHVSLVNALAARFPVCSRIVGEAFFTAMARAYVADHKPASPVLLDYGSDFPVFIEHFPPAASVPYLPDIARLEVAWSEAYHAADQTPLSHADLQKYSPPALLGSALPLLAPTRLVRSPFSVGSIWSAHQQAQFVPPRAVQQPENILITRASVEVRVTAIASADADLVTALQQGTTFGQAASFVLATHPGFDPGAALVGLMGLGAFAQSQLETGHAAG